jgi:hypothetical protein
MSAKGSGWGLLPPKEVRDRKYRQWAEGMARAEEIAERAAAVRAGLPEADPCPFANPPLMKSPGRRTS